VQSAASGRSWTRDFSDDIHNEESLLRAFLAIGLGHGVAVKRDCAMRVGAFSDELRLVEDTEWFLRFLSLGFRPMPIRGAHLTVHCHAGPRMTDSTLHLARRRECERLLETMQPALASFPFLREQIQNVVGLSGAGAWPTSLSARGMANAAFKR
jgi:hypothetical protein